MIVFTILQNMYEGSLIHDFKAESETIYVAQYTYFPSSMIYTTVECVR